jgi:hypothetical protein
MSDVKVHPAAAGGETATAASVGVPRLAHIPDPDYRNHVAYGKLFHRPKLSTRINALKKWRAGYRQIMPTVRAAAAKKGTTVSRLLLSRDLPMAEESEGASPLLRQLARDGAVPVRLTPEERAEIRGAAAPFVAALQAKRAQTPDGKRAFRDNQLGIPPDEGRELHAAIGRMLAAHDIPAAASRYLGYTVGEKPYVNLQINGASDTSFWGSGFRDLDLPYPGTTYMHIDTDVGVLKCLLYLEEVTDRNGPFRYVLGSHRYAGLLERIIRKANDVSGLDSRVREARELFWALPGPLRRKAAFGYDLLDASPEAEALLAREHAFTSDDGDLILFDGDRGIHRGAMVIEGERQMLQIVLH